MRYCALNTETNEHVPLPLPDHASGAPPPPNIMFAWLPRIRCRDCPGKLYTAGPDTTVTNFEVHLKNKGHLERVQARLAKAQVQGQAAGQGVGPGGGPQPQQG
jgi:SWI/SNF-related matrix-associated actin-dependent regulator of chromatin subfamily B protein 1